MKKSIFVYPIVSILLSVCILFLGGNGNALSNESIIRVLLVWLLLFVPMASFVYSKVILKGMKRKKRLLFAMAHAVLIIAPALLTVQSIVEVLIPMYPTSAGGYSWGILWAFLGFIGEPKEGNAIEACDDGEVIARKGGDFTRRFLYPIFTFYFTTVSVVLLYLTVVPDRENAFKYGFLAFALTVMPVLSVLYPMLVVRDCKKRILSTLLHSAGLALSFLIVALSYIGVNSYALLAVIVLFGWNEAWAFLGIKLGRRTQNEA